MCDPQLQDRVTLKLGREGIVKFIGETEFAEGIWYGIELCHGKGKNNGNVDGIQYFVCPSNKGIFVRLDQIINLSNKRPSNFKKSLSYGSGMDDLFAEKLNVKPVKKKRKNKYKKIRST